MTPAASLVAAASTQLLAGGAILAVGAAIGTVFLPNFWRGRGERVAAMERNLAAAWSGSARGRLAVLRSLPIGIAVLWSLVALVVGIAAEADAALMQPLGALAAVLLLLDATVALLGRPRSLVPPRLRDSGVTGEIGAVDGETLRPGGR